MRPLIAISFIFLAACSQHTNDWPVYGGSKTASHYSALTDIDTSNVKDLDIAWEYHCGDGDLRTQIQVNPVISDGILYGVTPKLKLFALDAATGNPLWVFNAVDTTPIKGRYFFGINVCRGLTLYEGSDHQKKVFYGAGPYLYCIDAANGKPVTTFGENGRVDLHQGLGREVQDLYIGLTTPGIIYKDMIIIGSRVSEQAAAAPGHIRAYDVHSGKLRWIFHTIPHPGEAGYESWDDPEAWKHIGGANAWSGFSLDEEKGILFAPIGSASFDFYGGKRTGANLFANSVLALDANNGKRIWHYQTVHHDIWDRDLPTAPVLVNIEKDGKKTEAVAQITKSGFIFLLDRKTGVPLYPVKETPVPSDSALPGEKPWPTQPIPSFPQPFVRQVLTEQRLNHVVPDSSYQEILARLRTMNHDNLYTPPTKAGTVFFPGLDGGGEWGGPAYDPQTGWLYINASEAAFIIKMLDVKQQAENKETNLAAAKRIYTTNCTSCHGSDFKGSGNNPSLESIAKKYNEEQFSTLLSSGRRMMPGFAQLSAADKHALASLLLNKKQEQNKLYTATAAPVDPYYQLPFVSDGYHKFQTKEGYPAVDTPWGTLSAIDLNTGKTVWKQTLGDYPELKAKGIHSGTENYGGAAVTAGGLLFIAATSDNKIRAFNKRTGQLLWEHDLPASGFATPSVYKVKGKQYVVIACGGGKLGKPSGDSYVAFSVK
jgi:quinoprotein glucose dehydrogenase